MALFYAYVLTWRDARLVYSTVVSRRHGVPIGATAIMLALMASMGGVSTLFDR